MLPGASVAFSRSPASAILGSQPALAVKLFPASLPAGRDVRHSILFKLSLLAALLGAGAALAQPDLSGTYDVSTLTPLERPQAYGDKLYLTAEEAAEIEQREAARNASANQASDPGREAPEVGAQVGGYNSFWIDRGERANEIDGRFRTSIVSDPPNGRIPPMTPGRRGAHEATARLLDHRLAQPGSHRRQERRHGLVAGSRRPGSL